MATAQVQNGGMPNIATALKAEVTRLARKELRAQTDGFKRSLATYRTEIAALRKRVQGLEGALRRAGVEARRAAKAAPSESEESEAEGVKLRFRSQGMAANRKRLGLSAADFGLLVGTTGQSIYAWESGKARPRAQHLAAIASLRGLGKREALARLETLKQA
jgi:DNA-binding transcriptional regulator YiaG